MEAIAADSSLAHRCTKDLALIQYLPNKGSQARISAKEPGQYHPMPISHVGLTGQHVPCAATVATAHAYSPQVHFEDESRAQT